MPAPNPKPYTDSDSIIISEADFSLADTYARLRQTQNAAAICMFTGLVRDWQDATPKGEGKPTPIVSLTLECYPAMTHAKLAEIRTQAISRWQLIHAIIIHRIGRLLPHDQIVLVATAAHHRQPAIDAANFIMDYLKTEAPFWKAEETPDGTNWVEERDSDKQAAEGWKK